MQNVLLCSWTWYPIGGDWTYVENLKLLYEGNGYNVIPFSTKNEKNVPTEYERYFITAYDYKALNKSKDFGTGIKALKNSVLSVEAMNKIDKLLQENDIAFAHLNIIHHWLTPSIIWKLKKHKVPIIWSLHDYKLICPEGSFVSNGVTCERCYKTKFYNCTKYKCKKASLSASFLASVNAYFWHLAKIYKEVDFYLCPSQFLLNKYKQFGFKEEKLVLSNLVYDIPFLDSEVAFIQEGSYNEFSHEKYILFVGRIEKVKGILTLIDAVAGTEIKLKVAGTGPDLEEMREYLQKNKIENVEFIGFQTKRKVFELTIKSAFVVCPSEGYEIYPYSIIETLLLSKAVVGARSGGIPEQVIDGSTGLIFEPANVQSLKSKLQILWNDEKYTKQLGEQGRKYIYEKVNFETHWAMLHNVIQSLPIKQSDSYL